MAFSGGCTRRPFARHRQGESNQARQWFDKAMAWMDDETNEEEQRTKYSRELEILRSEAAAALGLEVESDTEIQKTIETSEQA